MAMRVKHVQRAPNLVDEIKLAKAFEEAVPVKVTMQIERYVTKRNDKLYGSFQVSWNTVVNDRSIDYCEDNHNYYYAVGNFAKYMKYEIKCLRNYVNRLRKEYTEVNVEIIRSWTDFHDYD